MDLVVMVMSFYDIHMSIEESYAVLLIVVLSSLHVENSDN